MPVDLSYDDICAKFDRLLAEGIITYQPSKPLLIEDQGMLVRSYHSQFNSSLTCRQFSFHIIQSLKTKPQAGDSPAAANSQGYFGPGSDIANDHPDICVTIVNGTHYLIINKFPVFRPTLLLLTVDSYRRQHEPLALDDIHAAWDVICDLKVEHYAFFNCTVTAGSSREHKHLQVLPAPGASEAYPEGYKFFPDSDESLGNGPLRFTHFLQRFNPLSDSATTSGDKVFDIYTRLLKQTRAALSLEPSEAICPHNFILTKRWMMVVPRRAAYFQGISTNAAGMVGTVFLWNQDQLEAWKEIGPMNILAALGLPVASDGVNHI